MVHRLSRAVYLAGSLIVIVVVPSCGDPPSAPSMPAAFVAVTGVSPDTATTSGGANLVISGTGFSPGATVLIGGTSTGTFVVVDSSTVIEVFQVTPHVAGTVDVIVTNPGHNGGTAGLTAGFTYALPDSLDFNGSWEGTADDKTSDGAPMHFVIQNGVLVSASCGTSGTITFTGQPAVRLGEFSVANAMTGRIVSAAQARGTISLGSCVSTTWFATKK